MAHFDPTETFKKAVYTKFVHDPMYDHIRWVMRCLRKQISYNRGELVKELKTAHIPASLACRALINLLKVDYFFEATELDLLVDAGRCTESTYVNIYMQLLSSDNTKRVLELLEGREQASIDWSHKQLHQFTVTTIN